MTGNEDDSNVRWVQRDPANLTGRLIHALGDWWAAGLAKHDDSCRHIVEAAIGQGRYTALAAFVGLMGEEPEVGSIGESLITYARDESDVGPHELIANEHAARPRKPSLMDRLRAAPEPETNE